MPAPIAPTLAACLSTAAPPGPLDLPSWAPWTLIVLGGVMLALWWTGSRRAATAGRAQGASLVNRLLRSANAPRRAPAPAPPIDDETLRVADDLCARLDERAARLETLLREAKDAIARLEALSAAASSTANEPRRAPRARQRAAVSDAPQHDPPLVEVSRAAAPALIAGATLAADPLCARVYELADAGADAVSIAKQLSEHTGKVQLILALRTP